MRMTYRPLATVLAVAVLAACSGSSKPSSGGTTTVVSTPAGVAGPTTTGAGSGLVQKFVYQPQGFCSAFSNYLLYVAVAAAPFASGSSSSTSVDPSADAKAGAAALAFAPSIAPTTEVLQTDSPEEVLGVFHEFDAYNDEAVKAMKALGVDTDAYGQTVAGQLAGVDLQAPSNLPDTASAAAAGGIDAARLDEAGAAFVKDHGTLEAVFEKYTTLPDPTPERQHELISKYPCLAVALGSR